MHVCATDRPECVLVGELVETVEDFQFSEEFGSLFCVCNIMNCDSLKQ